MDVELVGPADDEHERRIEGAQMVEQEALPDDQVEVAIAVTVAWRSRQPGG